MVDEDCTIAGFTLYGNQRKTRLLLPAYLANTLELQDEIAAQKVLTEKKALVSSKAAEVAISIGRLAPHRNMALLKSIDFNIEGIRTDSDNDLSDATTLTTGFLAKVAAPQNCLRQPLSNDLLLAITLDLAYIQAGGNIIDVLDYLRDPLWDSSAQLVLSFRPGHNAFRQNAAAEWVGRFSKKVSSMTSEEMEAMVAASYLHWTNVVQATGKVSKKIKRQASVQVFDPNSLERTAFRFNELKDDRRAAGARILQSAQKNNGERSLPNCKAAYSKLEAAKSNFENLVEPIQRLQIDLTLSAAMKPNKFRLSPILLLGEPGIGKTYLATQLAEALGVCTEKISAGGSQGGFQMTGSHTGWAGARPGMIFTLLAEGDSAAPVLVIDEVEKIKDATYPVLPVLLDLLDAGSGTKFKDEFFELEFDASRIIFIMTANSIVDVPPALLSRVEVFDVPPPKPAQRLRIIREIVRNLCLATRRTIELDESSCETLSQRIDIDLRRVTRLVNEAFTKSMRLGEGVASLSLPKFSEKRSIGFH